MEFEQLRQCLRIAETRNFTRAAQDIGLSQSALSRSVSRLEAELGQPLFERKPRTIALTDVGEVFIARAQQILALVEDTKAQISDDGESGRVRVGAIPTIAPFFLPPLLRKFGKGFPRAQISIAEDTTDNLLKKCADGDVDVAIVALPITVRYLEVQPVFDEELLLVLAKGHPLVDKKQIRLTDIRSLPFVLLNEAHCLTDNIQSFCRQKSFHPVSVERTSQLATVQELVTLNHGVSLVPQMAARLDNSKRRVYRSIAGDKPTRTIALVWNPYRFESKLQTSFRQLVCEAVE